MIFGPKPMRIEEAALRFVARRGGNNWMVLVAPSGGDPAPAAKEMAQEMESLGDLVVTRITDARDADDLASRLAATHAPTVVSGLDGWPGAEWAHLDHLRSRFARDERTALVLGEEAFARLMTDAPNFASWLGASVVSYQPDTAALNEEERARRLEALREWSGLSDEEVVARAAAGTLAAEPEFAEWLVLLQRGDLLGR